MQTPRSGAVADCFPGEAELAALRSWYAGVKARDAIARYLGPRPREDAAARSALGRLRRRLAAYALARHRPDLAAVFLASPAQNDSTAVSRAIEGLRWLPLPSPVTTDPVGQWFSPRIASALAAHGVRTIADVCVRVCWRRRWWDSIEGLGAAGASHVEALIAAHPELTRQTGTVQRATPQEFAPWEKLLVPEELNGARGQFRTPSHACLLDADNDYEAVQSWLTLHESRGTHRAYRKEVERLMLWAIIERRRALSSLTTDDALAYRTFLKQPTPSARWTGPARPRHSTEWRPFVVGLAPRSTAYSLAVLAAMYRWLVEQHYVFAIPLRTFAWRPPQPAWRT